jgi:hypothetical protein
MLYLMLCNPSISTTVSIEKYNFSRRTCDDNYIATGACIAYVVLIDVYLYGGLLDTSTLYKTIV